MTTPTRASTVADRLADVRARLDAAAVRAGRRPSDVTLVAVSKTFDADAVREAAAAGQTDFGESRAQELVAKRAAVASDALRWHFVGRLQRNKVRDVAGTVALVHAVDRAALAASLSQRARRRGVVQDVLVQVNAGDDPAKAGCAPQDTARLVAAVAELEGLRCRGLMTIPPLSGDPRPVFARLRALRDAVADPGVAHLSMGMTSDFEVAVEEGATIVRLGEAIFGPRPRPA